MEFEKKTSTIKDDACSVPKGVRKVAVKETTSEVTISEQIKQEQKKETELIQNTGRHIIYICVEYIII
jgi:hypothetical protein